MRQWGGFSWGAIPWGVMEYDYYRDRLSRTPVSLVVLTLDYCDNAFGAAPCNATGTPCYNTYRTCKDKDHYSRGYKGVQIHLRRTLHCPSARASAPTCRLP